MKNLYLYAHTHWDREWYWSFEKYRTQLCSVTRQVIEDLNCGTISHFHLDGQVSALEDVLFVMPELTSSVKRLVKKGSLSIGPWYVLADQMLVGGEALIRNLDLGLRVARKFGEPMMVGYCPDTFGHTRDLPRILKGFGIETAVVWRGVPALCEGPQFYWQSPDGSKVLAYLLPDGYYQTAFHELQHNGGANTQLREYLLQFIEEDGVSELTCQFQSRSRSYCKLIDSALVPVGGDHLYPPVELKRLVEGVGRTLLVKDEKHPEGPVNLTLVNLFDYLEKVRLAAEKPLTLTRLIDGELRDNSAASLHCRAYMLAGVLSTRLYLKRANRRAEHRMVRRSEPVLTMLSMLCAIRYPEPELEHAWRLLLANQPHDSICGCSVDEVHRQMMSRYQGFHDVLDLLDLQAREELMRPGLHEWSATNGGADYASLTDASLTDASLRDENNNENYANSGGFGRLRLDLLDPQANLSGFLVFNLSASDVSSPLPFEFAVPAESLGLISYGESRVVSADEVDLAQLLESLDTVLGDYGPMQVDTVRAETEVFGSLSAVPVYKDVCVASGWLWPGLVPSFGVSSLSFDQKELVFAESGRIRTTSSIKRSDSGCDTADGAAASWEHGRPVRSGLGARTSRPLRAGSTDVPSAVSSIDHDCGSDNGGAHGLDCVDVSARRISNGIFTLQIDEHANMLVTARHKDNQIVEYGLNLKFQDIGDGGDSYNFDPIKDDVPIVARLKSVSPHLLGPLVGSLRLIHEIDIPESAVRSDDRAWLGSRRDLEDLPVLKRSKGVLRHELITDVILKRGVPIVFFDTSWQNLASDHRLEVLIDTGAPVKTTWSENHFCLIERKLAKNVVDLPVGRAEEAPLDRFACQRFFLANKQVFLNAGLSEYAVEGNKVAYTILRAVSMLSRKRLLTRGGGAGPHMPVPEANCPGLNQVSFGWAPLAVLSDSQDNCINDADIAAAYIFAESFEDPLWLSPMGRGGGRETDNLLDRLSTWHCQGNHFKALALNDQNVRVTALYSQDGGKSFLLRLLNTSPLPRSCRLDIYMPVKKVELVSLSGKRVKTSRIGRDGSLNLAFGKNELLTLKLTPAGDALPGPQPEPEPE